MYSKIYSRVRGVGAAGGMCAFPRPHPQPCLYVCEHFANKVRELLVNIASDLVPSKARVQGDAFGGYLHPR
jgi:hypothetical protein